jgi:general secretion pathway protein G
MKTKSKSHLLAYKQIALSHRGFTLLELLVVMVIIGMLVSYVGPKYFAQIGKSEVKTARAQIDALEKPHYLRRQQMR